MTSPPPRVVPGPTDWPPAGRDRVVATTRSQHPASCRGRAQAAFD